MKITAAEAWIERLPMEEPYAVAYQTADTAENVFLRVETGDGLVGFGATNPDPHVTGETAEGTLAALKTTVIPFIMGTDASRWRLILAELMPIATPAPRNVVDMALHDLLGKRAGMPLWKLLGGYRDKIPTSVTIGILPEKETVERARHWVARDFSFLKLKGGKDPEGDAARLWKVREAVGREIRLCLDPNQGYSVDATAKVAALLKDAGVLFIEQPTPASAPAELADASRRVAIPLMADESLKSAEDAESLARLHACRLFNVKLAKTGGIDGARGILSVARAHHIDVMMGCMDDSALGIAAALHLALASPEVSYADLDGHIGLEGDPFHDAVEVRDGFLIPRDRPGLGTAR